VVIHIKEHEYFERDGENLYCEMPVNFATAALGGEVHVTTLEGAAALKIPAATQSGAVFKLKSKGMPVLNTSTRGDLLVRIVIAVPQKLSPEQRKKLEEFAEVMGDEISAPQKGVFERVKELFK
jgi:molecular chaperone DnaJ